MTDYPPEKIYEIWWWGPYTLKELKKEDKDYLATLSLYAIYDDHPLYGKEVLTYIGKTKRSITIRLGEHNLHRETIYVANISEFKDWKQSDAMFEYKKHLDSFIKTKAGANKVIEDIEALLINALRPADNSRNKSTAKHSWSYRLFNTGHVGSLPREVSGHYTLENVPDYDDELGEGKSKHDPGSSPG